MVINKGKIIILTASVVSLSRGISPWIGLNQCVHLSRISIKSPDHQLDQLL